MTDPTRAAAAPHLAVLSAIEHHNHPDLDKVLQALPHALATLETDLAIGYADVMLAAMPDAARQRLEEIVSTYAEEHQSDVTDYILRGQRKGHQRGLEQGRVEGLEQGQITGERNALLAVLEARGIKIPDHTRTTITDCPDLDQLTTWLHRAATAATTNDIFD